MKRLLKYTALNDFGYTKAILPLQDCFFLFFEFINY